MLTKEELLLLAECSGEHISMEALFTCDSCNLLLDDEEES